MIKTWQHKGLRRFFERGSTAGIRADHAQKLARQLRQLNDAAAPQDMNVPGWYLHLLHGDLERHWAVKVNGNWRLTFYFDGVDAVSVDYLDYH